MESNPLNEKQLRVLGFRHCPNFRDLGGYHTADGQHRLRYGRLYRHGRLSELSTSERMHLGEGQLALRTVVDFRADSEVAEHPAPLPHGTQLVSIKMQDPRGVPKRWGRRAGVPHPLAWAQVGKAVSTVLRPGTPPREPPALQTCFEKGDLSPARELAANGMPQVYNWLVTDPNRKSDWRRFLAIASDSANLPLSFTCNAGKDRTAIGALLILTALGVGEETIIQDYLLTNECHGEGKPDTRRRVESHMESMARLWSATGDLAPYSAGDRAILAEALATISGAHEINITEAFRAMKAVGAGSVRGFMVAELGWTSAMEARLRAAVLEPAVAPGTIRWAEGSSKL
jgi:protein-tyrosine phosphatase